MIRPSQSLPHRFLRNVALVASGTAGAQAISLAFAPAITRIYGPESFGVLGVFAALGSVLGPLAALGFPLAIVLPEDQDEARELALLSISAAVIMTLLTGLAVLLAGEWLAIHSGLGGVSLLLMLIPFVFFSGCLQVAQQWLIRLKAFSVTARVAVVQSLATNSTKVGVGLFKPTGAILVWIATLAVALHTILLLTSAKPRLEWADLLRRSGLGWRRQSELARKYSDFALYRAPQGSLNAVSQGLPVILLGVNFGAAAAGYYALGRLVMTAPITIIGQAITSVLYPQITEASHAGQPLEPLIVRSTLGLGVVGVLPFGAVMLFGPTLFALVFGGSWHVAGSYAQWLAILLLSALMIRPSVAALPVLRMQSTYLFFEIAGIVLRLGALLGAAILLKSDIAAVAGFCIVGTILNCLLMIAVIRRSRQLELSGEAT